MIEATTQSASRVYTPLTDDELSELYPGGRWMIDWEGPEKPTSLDQFEMHYDVDLPDDAVLLSGGPYDHQTVVVPEYVESFVQPGEDGYVDPEDIDNDQDWEYNNYGHNFRYTGPEEILVQASAGSTERYFLNHESEYAHESRMSERCFVGGPQDGEIQRIWSPVRSCDFDGVKYELDSNGDMVWKPTTA